LQDRAVPVGARTVRGAEAVAVMATPEQGKS